MSFLPIHCCILGYVLSADDISAKDKKTRAEETEIGKFQWIDKHQKAFGLLKANLTRSPNLGYLDFIQLFEF